MIRDPHDHLDVKFWLDNQDELRHYYSLATEELQIDRTAGLMQLEQRIWAHQHRVRSLFMLLFRLFLNMYSVANTSYRVLASDHVFFPDSRTRIFDNALVFCEDNMTVFSRNEDGGEGVRMSATCVSSEQSIYLAFRLVSLAELIIVGTLCGSFVVAFALFLFGGERTKKLPEHRPFLFMFAPGLSCSTSGLSCIQFLNKGRMESILFRGEGMLNRFLIRDAIFPMTDEKEKAEVDEIFAKSKREKKHRSEGHFDLGACYHFLVLAVMGAFFCVFAFFALLVKLSIIHFVTVRTPSQWSLQEWLLAFGFINQLGGICHAEDIEMHRVLLFKFGGAASEWDENACRVVVGFLHLLAKKVAEGRIGANGRMHTIAALCSLTSDHVQMLFMNPELGTDIKLSRDRRLQYINDLFPSGQVGKGASAAERTARARTWMQMLEELEEHKGHSYDGTLAAKTEHNFTYTWCGDGAVDTQSDDEDDEESPSWTERIELASRINDFLKQQDDRLQRDREELLAPDGDGHLVAWKLRLAGEIQITLEDLRVDWIFFLMILGMEHQEGFGPGVAALKLTPRTPRPVTHQALLAGP